jgi:hypothetical protein
VGEAIVSRSIPGSGTFHARWGKNGKEKERGEVNVMRWPRIRVRATRPKSRIWRGCGADRDRNKPLVTDTIRHRENRLKTDLNLNFKFENIKNWLSIGITDLMIGMISIEIDKPIEN